MRGRCDNVGEMALVEPSQRRSAEVGSIADGFFVLANADI